MSVIENFAALSEQEQKAFAEALLKTINSEGTFTSETHFEFDRAEADDITGGLYILAGTADTIPVSRDAQWYAANEDDLKPDIYADVEYSRPDYEDAAEAFKTTSAVIDGYKITLTVEDVQEEDTIDTDVTEYTHEDDGIGWNDYWGVRAYDSRPYLEVTGILTKACYCAVTLFVEPDDTVTVETEHDEEA